MARYEFLGLGWILGLFKYFINRMSRPRRPSFGFVSASIDNGPRIQTMDVDDHLGVES